MKKFFLFVPVVALLAMSSCKKDYVCNCVTTSVDSFSTFEIDQDIPFKATSGKSEDECKGNEARLNTEYSDGSSITTTTCKLK